MSKFDRYLLSQLVALFGFFALILVSVYWVNRAVGLFDRLIGDGHSALVFLEFSLLMLPNVIRLVLPIAAFAATVYVTNRLTQESELVVMQATGFSGFRLARPVLYFGGIVTALHLLLMNVLVPWSGAMLSEREAALAENVTARYLTEGQFMHPAAGVTLYIRDITQQGELRDLFLSDERNTAERTTYTARRALLARGDNGPTLLMFDGIAQTLTRDEKQSLSVTRFADVTYDLSGMLADRTQTLVPPDYLTTMQLLTADPQELQTRTGAERTVILQEVHTRLAQPFLSAAAAMVGFATLLIGAFSRFGLWRQILGAVGILIFLQLLNTTGSAMALENARLWPAVYVAPLAGLGIAALLLHLAQRPGICGGGGMTLSLYIARRFLGSFLVVLGVFFGIMLLIDTIDQLRRLNQSDAGLIAALHLAALNVPESLYRILPLIVVLAAISLFMALARSSELVVVRAAGRSGLRFLIAPVVTALISGLVAVAVVNPFVAATNRLYDNAQADLARGGSSAMSVSENGLWLRQGDGTGQTVIQAARTNQDGTELYGVSFLLLDAEGLPAARIEADIARLEPGAWVLEGAKRWDLTARNPEQSAAQLPDGSTLPSDLTREGIRDSFGSPSAIPFWSLPTYIAGLERAGFSARAHQVWFQMELAQPLLLAAMVLVAAGFTMRHARFGKTGTLVLFAVLSGFAIFFLRNFAQVLGENGQIPVALAAWAPPVAATMMALGLLLHLEDG